MTISFRYKDKMKNQNNDIQTPKIKNILFVFSTQ